MEITSRPIRPEERALVEGRHVDEVPLKGDAIFATLLTAFPIWFVVLFGVLYMPRHDVAEFGYTFGTLIVLLFASFRFYMKRIEKAVRARNVEKAARRAEYRTIDQVEVWNVRIVDAIEIEIDEDTGSQFYLELEDGRVMVLDEDWLERDDIDDDDHDDDDDDDDYRPWAPNRELIVTRLPEPHHHVLDVQRIGEFFEPSHKRAMTAEEWESGTIRDEGVVLPGPLSRYAGVGGAV